ncbi:hypothetical protein QJS66_15410 [Kocuria rhizophila]|nr:hypothetical protein QJS66_15410 [Kocuria rhizophila]
MFSGPGRPPRLAHGPVGGSSGGTGPGEVRDRLSREPTVAARRTTGVTRDPASRKPWPPSSPSASGGPRWGARRGGPEGGRLVLGVSDVDLEESRGGPANPSRLSTVPSACSSTRCRTWIRI